MHMSCTKIIESQLHYLLYTIGDITINICSMLTLCKKQMNKLERHKDVSNKVRLKSQGSLLLLCPSLTNQRE